MKETLCYSYNWRERVRKRKEGEEKEEERKRRRKKGNAVWGHPRWTRHSGEAGQSVVHWRRELSLRSPVKWPEVTYQGDKRWTGVWAQSCEKTLYQVSADSSLVPGPVSEAGRQLLDTDPDLVAAFLGDKKSTTQYWEGLVCKAKAVSVFVLKGRGMEADSRQVWGAAGSLE